MPSVEESSPAGCRDGSSARKPSAFTIQVVAAVIEDARQRILITRRRQDQRLGGYWEFPGGKVERGEGGRRALQREIREEIGVEITSGAMIHSVTVPFRKKNIRLRFYEARIRSGRPKPLEVEDLKWVHPEELDQFQFPPADEGLLKILKNGTSRK